MNMGTCLDQNNATTTLNQTLLHIQKLLDTNPCPVKFPTFAGLDKEDFVIFRDRFARAAQARGICKTDQVDKLREVLAGKALAFLPPEGIGDIDVAWTHLEQVYGNSRTILNFHLSKLVSMPSMTDEIVETNPQDAADWYFDMEILVDSILRVGSRSQELRWLTFSSKTMFHCVFSKLPHRLLDRTYELDTLGEEKMRQVLQLIRRARANAQARATDITTDMILSSTAMALSPSSRAPDTGHMMGTSSQPVRATTRPAPHPTSLLPSLCQPSSDTFLSPTPLPCMPDTMDTDPSSLCSSPDIPMTVSEQSHSSSTSLPIMSPVMDSRPDLTTDTELLSLSSNPAIRVSAMNGTADMLTSQLLSVADDPVYLDEDPCSVDWLCVLSHRISMDTPTTAKIQSPSTLMADKSPCAFVAVGSCPLPR